MPPLLPPAPPPSTAPSPPLVQVLARLPAASGVLVSAGEKGSSYAFRGPGGKLETCGVVPVLDVKVADTTGAGDAYLAGARCLFPSGRPGGGAPPGQVESPARSGRGPQAPLRDSAGEPAEPGSSCLPSLAERVPPTRMPLFLPSSAGFLFYMLMAGGLDSLLADPAKLDRAVRFATACGAFTCTRPGAIDAQPTVAQAEALLQEAGLNG